MYSMYYTEYYYEYMRTIRAHREFYFAAVLVHLAEHRAEQRGLAAAHLTDYGDQIAPLHLQIDSACNRISTE